MEKVKFHDLVQQVSREAFKEAIGIAKPKYKEKSNEELAEIMGLTEYQFDHFADRALGKVVADKVQDKMLEILKNKDSIEMPHAFNIFVHESKSRTNEKGEPVRKLSIRTRRAVKQELN